MNRFFLTPPIFAEARFAFFALIFLGGQAGFSTAAMARSPELWRLFQQPDLLTVTHFGGLDVGIPQAMRRSIDFAANSHGIGAG